MLQTLKEFFLELKLANWVTFGVGITAIVVQVLNNELLKVSYPDLKIYFSPLKKLIPFQPRVAKKCSFPIPIQLIVVVAGILVSHFLELNKEYDVDITGPIRQGFPPPLRPSSVLIKRLWSDSIVVGLVGYSVTLSLAKIFAERFKYEVDGNQEILAEVTCVVAVHALCNL